MSREGRPWDQPYFSFERYMADNAAHPGGIAWAALSIAAREQSEPELQEIPETGVFDTEDRLPRWPSTIHTIDVRCGGLYGLTTVLGSRGLGKTLLALGSCLEAAATHDWQVVYLSAELDAQEVGMRVGRYFERHPGAIDALGFLHLVHLGRGFDVPDLVNLVTERTDPMGPPILVCLDSINTAVELSGREYLGMLRRLSLWAMYARRMSAGIASFLLVSEVNKLGTAKGGALDYWSDVVVRLSRPRQAGVEIHLDKSRRTAGEGSLGLYARGLTRFEPRERHLRAVGAPDYALED